MSLDNTKNLSFIHEIEDTPQSTTAVFSNTIQRNRMHTSEPLLRLNKYVKRFSLQMY